MVSTLLERRLTRRQLGLRDQLVDLVLAEGFSHLTMDDFAAQLGCSKRTLYALARSKDQLATEAIKHFFRRATDQVEESIGRTRKPDRLVIGYLQAVAKALRPASRRFLDDMASFPPGCEVYDANTAAAAERVRQLIAAGTESGSFRKVPAPFVAEVVTSTMRRITSGEMEQATGLTDAEAYTELAKLVVAAVRA